MGSTETKKVSEERTLTRARIQNSKSEIRNPKSEIRNPLLADLLEGYKDEVIAAWVKQWGCPS